MKIKVKALHTLVGDYGTAQAGDHIEIDEVHAKGLHEKGAIEFLHKADEKKADESAKPKEGLMINDRQEKESSKQDAPKEKVKMTENPGVKKVKRNNGTGKMFGFKYNR